jgi:hypothetical protein
MHYYVTGNDFTDEGVEYLVQFKYTGFVSAVTEGLLDVDTVAVALQAADFFGIAALRHAAEQFVQLCGGSV